MFQSHKRLNKRTPESGINREEYIGYLVDEFHTTTNIEFQEQISANLANFSYDPINYPFLKANAVIDLFIQCLEIPNQKLALHATAGICNLCSSSDFLAEILDSKCLEPIKYLLLKTTDCNIKINIITIFYLILLKNSEYKSFICTRNVLESVEKLRHDSCKQLSNLCTLFYSEFGRRTA